METLPAGEESSPTLPETNLNAEEFVRAVMAKNCQEMKDILYESCEQAVQSIAHRILTIYLQSGGSMSSTADSGDGPTLSNSALPTREQSAASRPSITNTATPLAVQVPADAQVFGSTTSEDPMPPASPSQPRKVSFDTSDLPLKQAINGIATPPLSRSNTRDTLETLTTLGSINGVQRGKPNSRVKHKAHTKKSLLSSAPRASSASRATRPTLQQRAQGARPTQLATQISKRSSVTNSPAPAQGIFANAEAMKEKLRAALTETPYDVTNYYSTTGWCQAVARSTILENVVLSVIAFNALWISVDADLNDATIITDAPPLFIFVDNFFCIFFLFEISVRFGAFEVKNKCLRDPWFVFDASMATMMMIETWLLPIVVLIFATKQSGASGDGTYKDASLLKGLRLARLMRMARVLRLLRALPELMVVIKGLFVATRAVSCTVLLMLMIIYVFAITFRQITDGTEIGRKYFSSVPQTMRYLMVQGTMPDLSDAIYAIWDEGVFFALCFLLFIFVTSITVMNMLVGILVGVIDTVASVEKEQLMVHFVKDHLLTLLTEMHAGDADSDGLISKFEFCKLIQTPDAIRSFTAMGVDVVNLVDLADFLFTNETVGIPFGDFMEMIMQLRGSNQATVKDIVDLRRFVTMEMRILFRAILDRLQPEMNSEAHDDIAGNTGLQSFAILNDVLPGLHFQKTMSGVDKAKKLQQASPNDQIKAELTLLETVTEPEDEGLQPSPPQPSLDLLASADEQEGLTVEERKAAGDLETCKKRKVKITRKSNAPKNNLGSLKE